ISLPVRSIDVYPLPWAATALLQRYCNGISAQGHMQLLATIGCSPNDGGTGCLDVRSGLRASHGRRVGAAQGCTTFPISREATPNQLTGDSQSAVAPFPISRYSGGHAHLSSTFREQDSSRAPRHSRGRDHRSATIRQDDTGSSVRATRALVYHS